MVMRFTIHYGEIKTFCVIDIEQLQSDLQSTMVRLRRSSASSIALTFSTFTIHYGEIKTRPNLQSYVFQRVNLQSTMVRLRPYGHKITPKLL